MLEKTLESPLDCKEIQPVHPKGDQSWIFTGGTDAEAETLLWSPDAKNWLIWKDRDVGKDWRQEEKGMTEDEMVGWHHRLDWTWVWVSSGSWWRTGKSGVLQSMGLQRVGHDWVTELSWKVTLQSYGERRFAWCVVWRKWILWDMKKWCRGGIPERPTHTHKDTLTRKERNKNSYDN